MTFDNEKWKRDYIKGLERNAKRLAAVKMPKLEGFEESIKLDSTHFDGKTYELKNRILENKDFKVRFIYQGGGVGTTEYWYEPAGKPGFWASFDRRGVDNSFYWIEQGKPDRCKTTAEMIEVFKEQIERVKKMRDYATTAIQIPEIGFSVSPDGKVKHLAALQLYGYTQFTPSGFGTGYTISKRKQHSYSKPASQALIDFWGVGSLYISTMDCD